MSSTTRTIPERSKQVRPPISPEEERIGGAVVHAAFLVHKALGPGLLESVYETCFCHELTKAGIPHARQKRVSIAYDGLAFEEGLQLDVLAADLVICELKAVQDVHPIFRAQLLSYLRLTGKRLGFLIN